MHRFFVPVARAAVDEDGHAAKALHPTVWSGPHGLWRHGFVGWPLVEVCEADVGFWIFLLVFWLSFVLSCLACIGPLLLRILELVASLL